MIKTLLIIISIGIIFFQKPTKEVYVESWKRGDAQIEEQTLVLEVNKYSSQFNKKINNIKGKDKYLLSCVQINETIKSKEIIGWSVSLVENKFIGKKNLLSPVKDLFEPSSNPLANDEIYSSDFPGEFIPSADVSIMGNDVVEGVFLPLYTKRIVKIEDYYCVLQVLDFEFSDKRKGYLQSMKINVTFTNTAPN